MARQKFLRGKLCYEKFGTQDESLGRQGLFARQYEIKDGQIRIAVDGEVQIAAVLPPDSFQFLRPGI